MNHPHLVGSHRQGSAMRWPEVPQPPEDIGHGTRVLS